MFLCAMNLQIRSVKLAFDHLKSTELPLVATNNPYYYDCNKLIFACIYDLLYQRRVTVQNKTSRRNEIACILRRQTN